MVLKPQDGTCSGFASLWNVRLSSLTRSISPEWQLGSDLSLTLLCSSLLRRLTKEQAWVMSRSDLCGCPNIMYPPFIFLSNMLCYSQLILLHLKHITLP